MKLCLGCFEHYDDGLVVCPHCGYSEDMTPDNAIHMIPGTILLDRYIIGKVIGFGGFGVTYAAYDPLLEMKVAVKEYLPSEFSTRVVGQTGVTVFGGDKSEQFADGMHKFVDEAKKLAKFTSTQGIVRIFDSFECNNTAYLVMELLEGETLSERLKRVGRIPADEAVKMMLPILKSLDEVHRDGIIHRDIAPDNIFITTDGKVKLIDFGAARYATTTHSRSLTVVIKPGYSPEEQYRSMGDQGKYTDVYAAAATLYRMMTGETPPDALERRAYFENKKKDILKPIRAFVPDIDIDRENAVLNALNVRVEDRTPDMQAFMGELLSTGEVKRRGGKIKPLDLYTWPKWAKIGVPVLGVGMIVFLVLLFTVFIGSGKDTKDDIVIPEGQTRVPSVVNNTYDRAEERLVEANLTLTILGREYDERIQENMVLRQNTSPGIIVPELTDVGVTISGGIIKQLVPNVVGADIETAQSDLESLKFQVVREEAYDSTIAEGCIISQSLEPNTEVSQGSEIVLVVSKGIDPNVQIVEQEVEVPGFVGMEYRDAVKLAAENGLRFRVEAREYSREYPEDTVMRQTPEKGSRIKNTQEVLLVVSKGYNKVTVPNVVFEQREQAEAIIGNAGLKIRIEEQESETVAAGVVISQEPAANTETEPESTVLLIVSKGRRAVSGTVATSAVTTTVKTVATTKTTTKTTTKAATTRAATTSATTTTKPQTTTAPVSEHQEGGTEVIPEVYTYSLGSGIQCEVDYGSNTLTISGSGALTAQCPYGSDMNKLVVKPGITGIGKNAFKGFSNLKNAVIANTVTSIGDYAFVNCTSLSSIVMPGVTSVGQFAFSGCTALKTINLPAGIRSIEPFTFSGCSNITSFKVPSGVRSIGTNAFSGCSFLREIYIPSSVTDIDMDIFGSDIPDVTIYCEEGSAAERYARSSGIDYSNDISWWVD